MIIKTFVGKTYNEIEERIREVYGPDAIILATVDIALDQVEVSFGIEENDFIDYQKQMNPDIAIEDEETDFWNEDTVPDVEYSPQHEELLNK